MFGGPNFDKKYKLEMLEEKHACKKQRLLEFPNGIPPHPKYSSSRIMHFVLHLKAPSPKIGAIHQFAFRVDPFHSF
jgi:hypothetical protein